jgi:GDPmannose 4,6-dehydratase
MTPPAANPPARALITGAAGQDGYYLTQQLLDQGMTVFAVSGAGRRPSHEGAVAIDADMRDAASLARAIDEAAPDEVYNLAALSFVPDAGIDPSAADDVNAVGLERLAEAILASGRPVRLCHASSAEMFGDTDRPIDEETPLRPVTPYGRSKARAHELIAGLRIRHRMHACAAILFNHESPRRPGRFVTRKITMAVARIARGLSGGLALGRLDAVRDWGYAPEYTEAMQRIVRAATPRDYVVATGRGETVETFARLAFARAGLDWRDHVVLDESLARTGDAEVRIGNPAKIFADLGWRATTTLEELVAIMVDADLALLDND